MVSCQWLQESSKNQQQQHFIWPRKLAREGKDHLLGVLFASRRGQRNVFLVFIVYAQQRVVKKTGVGFERWLAVGRSRQPGCDHKPIPQMGPHEKILLHWQHGHNFCMCQCGRTLEDFFHIFHTNRQHCNTFCMCKCGIVLKVFVELFIQSDGHAKMKVFSTLVTQRSKGCQPDAKTHARKKRGQHVQRTWVQSHSY